MQMTIGLRNVPDETTGEMIEKILKEALKEKGIECWFKCWDFVK